MIARVLVWLNLSELIMNEEAVCGSLHPSRPIEPPASRLRAPRRGRRRFHGDRFFVALAGERGIGDLQLEGFLHHVLADFGAGPERDTFLAPEQIECALRGLGRLVQPSFGGW